MIKSTTKQRFYENVNLNMMWVGRIDKDGYGRLFNGQKKIGAHRFSYELHNGKIPKGMCVLHSCDNPACVNPEHLHLGTNYENIQERVKRNRSAQGEKVNTSKLTSKDVIEIRNKHKNGLSIRDLMDEYGVKRTAISYIIHKINWKHI